MTIFKVASILKIATISRLKYGLENVDFDVFIIEDHNIKKGSG